MLKLPVTTRSDMALDQLMDNLVGAAPVKSRGILKAGVPELESTDLGEDCLDATELLGDHDIGTYLQVSLDDFEFDD